MLVRFGDQGLGHWTLVHGQAVVQCACGCSHQHQPRYECLAHAWECVGQLEGGGTCLLAACARHLLYCHLDHLQWTTLDPEDCAALVVSAVLLAWPVAEPSIQQVRRLMDRATSAVKRVLAFRRRRNQVVVGPMVRHAPPQVAGLAP